MTAPARSDSSRRAGSLLKVAVPLSMGIVFVAAFVFLFTFVGDDPRPRETAEAPEKAPETETVAAPEVPLGDPTNPNPPELEKPKTYGGEFPRWNLEELPKGWDPAVAATLHAFFEAMEPERGVPQPGIHETRDELREYLASLGPEALPTLSTILNADHDFVNRRFLLKAIGELGPESEQATFILRDFFMARHEEPGNFSEMIHTLDAMGKLQNDSSYEMLTGFVGRESLSNFRAKAVESLGLHRRAGEAVGILVDHMHGDNMSTVRNKAAQALGRVRDPGTLDEVYRAIDSEPYWIVKQTMLGTVGKIGDPGSVAFLESHARNAKESGVRLSAARAISRIATPDALGTLEDIKRTEPDPKVRRHIETWLAESEEVQ